MKAVVAAACLAFHRFLQRCWSKMRAFSPLLGLLSKCARLGRALCTCSREQFEHVATVKMQSFRKKELLCFMWDTNLTPKAPKLKEKLEAFLLEKFNLSSSVLSDKNYKKFQKDVLQFRTKLRAHAKAKSWQKERILQTYAVRLHF